MGASRDGPRRRVGARGRTAGDPATSIISSGLLVIGAGFDAGNPGSVPAGGAFNTGGAFGGTHHLPYSTLEFYFGKDLLAGGWPLFQKAVALGFQAGNILFLSCGWRRIFNRP